MLSRNIYWFHKDGSDFSSLRRLGKAALSISLKRVAWAGPNSCSPLTPATMQSHLCATLAVTNGDAAVTMFLTRLKLTRPGSSDTPSRSGRCSRHVNLLL